MASPEEPNGRELQLGLNNNPQPKRISRRRNQPAIMFLTNDIKGDYERPRGARCRVHDAADRRDLRDHCHAEGYLCNLVQLTQLARW